MSVSKSDQQNTIFSDVDSFPGFSDTQLRSTMTQFLENEDTEKPNVWNTATIAGIAMFLVSTVYILHLIGLDVIPDFGAAFVPIVIIGAILVGFVGFGFLVGDRRRIKQVLAKQRAKRQDYFDEAFPSLEEEDEEINLEEELFGEKTSGGKNADFSQRTNAYDKHSLKKSKKLYRSRTHKKIAGVCGGLAEYFGISVSLIRVIFVIAFFAGSGASMLLYIALMVILDKEPQKPLPDYDF